MSAPEIAATVFRRQLGQTTSLALDTPVIVTCYGQPMLVAMAPAEYSRLLAVEQAALDAGVDIKNPRERKPYHSR